MGEGTVRIRDGLLRLQLGVEKIFGAADADPWGPAFQELHSSLVANPTPPAQTGLEIGLRCTSKYGVWAMECFGEGKNGRSTHTRTIFQRY